MALIPVNRATLGDKKLKPVTSFAFAAKTPLCEIVAAEFYSAATGVPILFSGQGDMLVPVALMSLNGVDNLFVESNGAWSGVYLPAVLNRFPFVAQNNADGTPGLFIDDSCGLLSDDQGVPLFGSDEASDQASPVGRALQNVLSLDSQTRPTRDLVAKIAATGILQSVSLSPNASPEDKPVAGLQAVNQALFDALPDATILDLRRSGALPLIYAHLISLGQLAPMKARHDIRQAAAG
ncbi:MAG TPA: SapC family protein [Rhodospirillaceae bacterium]|nr:SapC family protein [Rhodospirillaceae bacterium]